MSGTIRISDLGHSEEQNKEHFARVSLASIGMWDACLQNPALTDEQRQAIITLQQRECQQLRQVLTADT